MHRLTAFLLAALVFPMFLYSVYGVLATFEPGPDALPWRIVWATALLVFAFIEWRLLVRLVRGPVDRRT